ncbi:MAG: hypothetical protein LBT83_11175 [Tannerella sp.]|jgi:hypothetical protein|nr:hypothetical protein [Tannerella sp.]
MDDCLIDYSEIGLSQEEILREIGYRDTLPDASVLEIITCLLARLAKEVRPRYLYFVSEGEINGTSVHIQNQQFETGPVITRLLDKSSSFAVFVATAGNEFEQIMQESKTKGDMLENYILDVMGTAIVEKAGDYIERMLEKELLEMLHTNRFSPGYCNWHLTEQRKIFGLLGNQPCGVALSDVCLMSPIKSISGIIGIGKDVEPRQYACRYCELESCFKRKK